jgi:uncharacterized protein (DUF4415 family)
VTRGGIRKGAGRPVGWRKENPKVQLSVRIDGELREWLRRQKNQAKVVEIALKEYREKNDEFIDYLISL